MDNNFNFTTYSRSLLLKLKVLRYRIEEKYKSSVRFIKNTWKFRKALSQIYWWDYQGLLVFMEIFFRTMADNVEKRGSEERNSRMDHNTKVYDRSYEIEFEQWNEFCDILKGIELSDQNDLSYESYVEKTNGRGLKTWWD